MRRSTPSRAETRLPCAWRTRWRCIGRGADGRSEGVCGRVGQDVAILKGNQVIHAHVSRVRHEVPRIDPIKVPLGDPEERNRVLQWLRSKNPDVDAEGNPVLDPKPKPELVEEAENWEDWDEWEEEEEELSRRSEEVVKEENRED